MKELHCPACGTPFVRATYQEGTVERLLNRMNLFPFRCQLCTNQFRAFRPETSNPSRAFDRRQFKRLPASFSARFIVEEPRAEDRVTDISMGGCTVITLAGIAQGTFLELQLKPATSEETIKVAAAMVCSVRPTSMGIKFLEFDPSEQQRLSQVVLGLLIGQGTSPTV